MSELIWSNEFPTESGNYWFYGDPYRGQMGKDFFEGAEIEKNNIRLYYVNIKGSFAICDGHLWKVTKFNKEKIKAGYLGYWAKVESIKLPNDTLNLFGFKNE